MHFPAHILATTSAAALLLVGQAKIAQAQNASFADRLIAAGLSRIGKTVTYDPTYVRLRFPGGDVPSDRGVCTDVVVRAYRAIGFDLQQLVHDDMKSHFAAYPRRWGLSRPDPNIDHRRVPNLRRFFLRRGEMLPLSHKGRDYQPGDLVTWDVAKPTTGGEPKLNNSTARHMSFARLPHIGIVTDRWSADGKRPLVVHNIGRGTVLEDMLFAFEITGRYRFDG
jgi:uncharacterized protein YijF (DUF1287 family)